MFQVGNNANVKVTSLQRFVIAT